jgi:hypothetical protein
MEITYLIPDETKILFKEFAYCIYRPANTKGEVTWRCPQCKFVTLKTLNNKVVELPSE